MKLPNLFLLFAFVILSSCSGDDSKGEDWRPDEQDANSSLTDAAFDSASDASSLPMVDASACIQGNSCDDGDPATGDDRCLDGACVGQPITCSFTQCFDSAQPNGVDCDLTPKTAGAPCDDGDGATAGDACDGEGQCIGEPIDCSPMQCDAAVAIEDGACVRTSKAVGAACDDGDRATRNDQCDGDGLCLGELIECVPGLCETSSTPNGDGCDIVYAQAGSMCDDGSDDTRQDQCNGSGGCIGSSYTCTPSACDTASVPNGDGCDVTFAAAGSTCDDNDDGTRNDACDATGGCVGAPYFCTPGVCEADSIPNGFDCTPIFESAQTPCDDRRLNTRNDVCDGTGTCAGEFYTCPSAVSCQLSNLPNGVDCTITNLPDGSNCSDNETCTVNDRCASGVCVGQSLCGNGTCDAICGENAGTCSADCLTTVGQCGPGENACSNWPDCHSTTTGTGLCANIGCGVGQVGNCFCDPGCIEFGDCCSDMQTVCGCP